MLVALLFCSLFYIALTEKDHVTLDSHYTGKECDTRLDFRDHYIGLGGYRGPKKGKPHYLWGFSHHQYKVLYCARVTSDKKSRGTVSYKLSVPEDALKGRVVGVQVIDRKAPGKGGEVTIANAEIGHIEPELSFESEKGKAMDYVVTVFGIPRSQ